LSYSNLFVVQKVTEACFLVILQQ